MKFKNLLFFVIATLCIFALSACGGGGSSSSGGGGEQVTQVRLAAVIGDSISTGFGVADPWPPRLAAALGVNITNTSRRGELTTYGLSVIRNVLDRDNPSHLLIFLGSNDAPRGLVSQAINNLQEMVDIARARNVIPVVATLPPLTNSSLHNSNAAAISDGIRGLNGAVIADVRAAFGNGSGLLADGVHPNNRGQQLIADTFFGVL